MTAVWIVYALRKRGYRNSVAKCFRSRARTLTFRHVRRPIPTIAVGAEHTHLCPAEPSYVPARLLWPWLSFLRTWSLGTASLDVRTRPLAIAVFARVDEHSAESKAFIDLPLLECAEVRGLVAVGHCRELHVELVDLMLVRSKRVLRDASDKKALQQAGHVFHPGLFSCSALGIEGRRP